MRGGRGIYSLSFNFNFKKLKDSKSNLLIKFQYILNDIAVLISEYFLIILFYEEDVYLIGENQFCKMDEVFGPPYNIPFLKLQSFSIQNYS